MTKLELHKRVAQLESMNDHLSSELTYIDQLMRQVGFTEGLTTVKATAQEMSQIESEDEE